MVVRSLAFILAVPAVVSAIAGTRAFAAPVAYITNFEDDTVSVLDTATKTVVGTVAVAASPAGIAVDPAGARAYVASSDAGTVSVLDTATNTIVATVAVGASPSGVTVSPAGTRVYVANACGT